MIKRTIEISNASQHLSVKHRQLVIQARGQHERDASTIPCEDIGFVVIDEPGTTCSHTALAELVAHGAVVVVCGRNHLPVGMLLPTSSHTEVVARLHEQIEVTKPIKKRLWKQIVIAKIRAQAANLQVDSMVAKKLLALSSNVRSGDPANIEAQAAKAYWRHWLTVPNSDEPEPFKRDKDGDGINALLNYGYAIIRAAVARAIVSAGLHPALGIHHCNRSNAFCLADDLMEPLRPLVDARVRELKFAGVSELNRDAKTALLELLTAEMRIGEATGPLMVCLHRYTASLVRCFRRESDRLSIPMSC